MVSYQYRDSHVKDKTVSPTVLSLTWESPYLEKMVFILSRGSKLWSGSNIWLSNELIPAGDPSSDKSISQYRKRLHGLHIMMMNQKAHYRISRMVLNHGTTYLTLLPIYGKLEPYLLDEEVVETHEIKEQQDTREKTEKHLKITLLRLSNTICKTDPDDLISFESVPALFLILIIWILSIIVLWPLSYLGIITHTAPLGLLWKEIAATINMGSFIAGIPSRNWTSLSHQISSWGGALG